MKAKKICWKEVDKNFVYDPETGVLYWKRGRCAGQPVGAKNGCGYLICTWQGQQKWYVHRLIAALIYRKDISNKVVDHIDYVKTNNRMDNLFLCQQRDNVVRRRLHPGKRLSRYQGVEKRTLSYGVRYRAVITVKGKKYISELYKSQKEAYREYLRLFVEHNSIYCLPPRLEADFARFI